MKYFEFGMENQVTLMLLHGVDTTWKLSFADFIEVAKHKYHIIAVAEDGFNPDEPEVDAISVVAEARKITEYIVENFDGKLDIILGESLGCMIMTEILLDPRISVHTAIADGFTILEYPKFKHELPKHLLASFLTEVEYFAFNHMSFFNKILGEDIDAMLYKEVSKKSLYNLERSMMPYRYKYEAYNCSDSYLWHGENEPGFKHVIKKMDRNKYHFAHKVFLNRGHGSLLLEPERMLHEVDLVYRGYTGRIKTE